MSSTLTTSVRIKAADIPTQLSVDAIATKYGVQVIKPPRSKSVLELRCTPNTADKIVAETQTVIDCLDLYSFYTLTKLLAAIDAEPSSALHDYMNELAGRISSNAESKSLFEQAGLKLADVMDDSIADR